MRIVLAGASGFLGQAWREHLARQGHDVLRLVRGEAVSAAESSWDPYDGQVDQSVIDSADVVANLAGAPIAHWPWTPSYKRALHDSRVFTTRTLAEAVAKSPGKPAFLAQSGVAGYGDRGDEVLTEESSTPADTVLGRITREWEAATAPAEDAGARVCVMRTAVVLHKSGGALKPLNLLFRAGLGGPIGSGRQYFATISLNDWLRAATFLATDNSCRGVYNLTGPGTTTNEEFTKQLGRMLNRPTLLRAPAWPMRKALGELSNELLGSVRVEPAHLLADGFEFEQPTLNERLAAALTP
ncbi:MAG TPA: TIGR01777 family oxidoreductase [Nocardioidaceae bacterium]|nr:TIGR01777 family oxidoreductase [Nocardioidaceae bacterium]